MHPPRPFPMGLKACRLACLYQLPYPFTSHTTARLMRICSPFG